MKIYNIVRKHQKAQAMYEYGLKLFVDATGIDRTIIDTWCKDTAKMGGVSKLSVLQDLQILWLDLSDTDDLLNKWHESGAMKITSEDKD